MTYGQFPTEEGNQYVFNGAFWEPIQNNLTGTLIPAGARTGPVAAPSLGNPNHRFLKVYLNVIAASATGSLTLTILGIEPLTGTLTQALLTAAAIAGGAANGLRVYEIGPGLPTGTTGLDGAVQSQSGVVPRTWTVSVAHGDASSWNYAVSYSLLM